MTQLKDMPVKEKQPRKPRARKPADYKTVHEAALRLTLSDQVELCRELKTSIQNEVAMAQDLAKSAQDIASGL